MFQISELNLTAHEITDGDTLRVSVKVKNTGAVAGSEVVQLYIHFPEIKMEMPEKLLRGFRKTFLKAGEEQTLHFSVPVSELAYYNPEIKKWVTEKTNYGVSVGNSSDELSHLNGSFIYR